MTKSEFMSWRPNDHAYDYPQSKENYLTNQSIESVQK